MNILRLVACTTLITFSLSCGGPEAKEQSKLNSLVGDLTITTNRDCKRYAAVNNPNTYCMGPVFRTGLGVPHGVLWELNGFSPAEVTRIKAALDFMTTKISEMNRYLYNNKENAIPRHSVLNCTEKYADRDFTPLGADGLYSWRSQISSSPEGRQIDFGSTALVRMLENHANYAVPIRIDAFFEDADATGVTLAYTKRNTVDFRQTTPGFLWLNTYLTGSKLTAPNGTDFYYYSPEAIAGVITHELMHRVGYMHGKGNNGEDYPSTFINEFGDCMERGGADRGGALMLINGKPRPALRCVEPTTIAISMASTPAISSKMNAEIINSETTIFNPGPTRFEWDDANKACLQQPDTKLVTNASCGQAERQMKKQGNECRIYINGEFRFTLRPGQDECPAMLNGSSSLEDGTYKVVARHSNKCLEVKDGSSNDGAALQQADCNGSTKQKFRMTYLNNGALYFMQPNTSSKCVDVKDGSLDNGTPVVQTECNFGQSQNVVVSQSNNGSYLLQFNHSQKCITVPDASKDKGKALRQSDCTGGAEQDWIFTKENPSSSSGDMCQYKHNKDTSGGKSGQTNGLDAFGNAKSCDKNGDWKTSCKDGNGDTAEVACGSSSSIAMCQYKHKKDTSGGKSGQTNGLDAFGNAKSCDKNGDWKTSCKDGKGETDEVACQ